MFKQVGLGIRNFSYIVLPSLLTCGLPRFGAASLASTAFATSPSKLDGLAGEVSP